MSLRIIFLGTAASVPTNDRSLPSIIVQREGDILMLDCGEGTQRQMIKAKIGLNRKMAIFITHMHGDHVLGLPGVIQTMSLLGRDKSLQIYGPAGIKDFLESIFKTVKFWLSFSIEINEIEYEGTVHKEREYEVQAVWAEHSTQSLAYAFIEKPKPGKFHPEKATALGIPKGPLWSALQRGEEVTLPDGRIVKPSDVMGPPRPGRKIVYSGDTRPSEKIAYLAENADVLIHEATLSDDLAEKAREEGHSTPSEAAQIALKANVKLLVLTHISARYSDPSVLLEQAKKIFPNTLIPKDLDIVEVPLPK
ncbi:MAG: ribonuclease Z [Candidatus Bathyarchaeota archaeon]|nr:ribonuclease Z [Candidatus Bathyarchaeota archaeon]